MCWVQTTTTTLNNVISCRNIPSKLFVVAFVLPNNQQLCHIHRAHCIPGGGGYKSKLLRAARCLSFRVARAHSTQLSNRECDKEFVVKFKHAVLLGCCCTLGEMFQRYATGKLGIYICVCAARGVIYALGNKLIAKNLTVKCVHFR